VFGGGAVRCRVPLRRPDQPGIDQVPAAEELGHLRAGPQGHRGCGVARQRLQLLGLVGAVVGAVRDDQTADRYRLKDRDLGRTLTATND